MHAVGSLQNHYMPRLIRYQDTLYLTVQHYMYMFNRHPLPSGNAKFAGGHLYNTYHTYRVEG